MPTPVGETIGPYRITEFIRAGGMGSVYRGVHLQSQLAVAIKTVSVPRESLLPAIRREIDALGKLRHPGIVAIRDSGTHRGIPWYAMELLGGRSLADLRAELGGDGARSPAALREVLTAIRRLCEPLAYLHGEGMVHGDLKPTNVLLAADDRPVLIDFGLMTAFGEQPGRDAIDTRAHAVGSLAYMAPEQIDGALVDARADLYALGCVLYELLTGRPPFVGERVEELLYAHRTTPPTPPSRLGLPRALDELVLRLLAKQPRDRIGHAEDLAGRLAALGAAASRDRGPRPRGYLYRPGLAGRDAALAGLVAEMSAGFAAGRGGLALVIGESGVGKTRLAAELARRAQAMGGRVLTGGCAPRVGSGGGAGLHALARPLQAVADRCRSEGPAETRRLLGGRARLLARHQPALLGLPGLDEQTEPAELPQEAARALVSHELVATFAALGEDRPLLLVLDDLQWADELTLAFLARLAGDGGLARARLFVLGTARSDEIGASLGQLLAAGTRRVDLDRLGEDGVRAMVADMLALPAPGAALVRFITRHTEGNPFFIAEYLRAAVDEGLIVRDERGRFQLVGDDEASLAGLPLPRSLRALIAARLDGLGPGARRVVDLAAVLGRAIDPALILRVAAIDEADFSRATGELVTRQILEDTGDGLRFAHDKLREVAYDALAAELRATYHRAVADELGGDVLAGHVDLAETAAQHWLLAGDDARALPLLLAAARRNLGDCEHERSVAHHRRALAILDGSPAAALRRELFAARALWREADDPGEAPRIDEASALREARRKAQRGLGDALTLLGRHDDALAAHTAALQHSADDVARADALGRMGAVCFARGELPQAAAHLEDALAHLGERLPASRPGALAAIAGSTARLAAGLLWPRRPASARERAVACLRVRVLNRLTYINYSFSLTRAVTTHLAALAAAGRVPTTRDAAETFAHHGPLFAGHLPASARRHARRAVAVCRREGHLAMQMTAEFMAGMCFTFQARWDEATAHFRAAIALYPRVGDLPVLQTAHENLAYVLLYRGDHDLALAEAAHALALAGRAGDIRGQCNSGCHVALASLRLGDLVRARRVVAEAAALLGVLEDHVLRCIVHIVQGRIERAAGADEAARLAYVRAVAIAGEHGLVQEEVVPAYTELLELYAGLPGAASETARLLPLARRLARRFPAHTGAWLRAEALLLAQRGRHDAARRTLARAVHTLRSRGMRHELARTLEVVASLAPADVRARARAEALQIHRETGAQADLRRVEAMPR